MKNKTIQNEHGSALLIAMVALITLTVIGIMAVKNTGVELQIAGNERQAKLAFFTAESARGYVAGHFELYNGDAMTSDDGLSFPAEVSDKSEAGGSIQSVGGEEYYCLDYDSSAANPACTQKFKGTVEFLDKTALPPRAGSSNDKFFAIVYEMDGEGYYDPGSDGNFTASECVKQGFYRVGL